MNKPDITRERWRHQKSLSYDPTIPEEFEATLIGWLESEIPRTGQIGTDALKKIEWICEHQKIDQGWLGYHTCGICRQFDDRGEALYICDNTYYVLPRMILHYIKDHHYLPPEDFLEDLKKLSLDSMDASEELNN